MTCNECLHSGVCAMQCVPHNILVDSAISVNVEHECLDFRDRSRFVELPCMVGDTVYVIENISGEEKIIQDHVETISIGYFADGVELYQFDGIKTDGYFSDFGKTVFLTREEAEQALNKTMQVLAASDS